MKKREFSLNKRGSHVGMILSFVIFITFLMMLYLTFQPSLKLKESKKQELDYIQNKVIENISEQVFYVTYSYTPSGNDDCLEVSIPTHLENKTVIAKIQGTTMNSESDGERVRTEISDSENKIVKFFYSESISTTPPTCSRFVNENQVEEELSQTREEIIEWRTINLIESHKKNYTTLKKNLGIADGTEFNIKFAYGNGTEIESKRTQKTNSVFAENIPVQYLNSSADINRGIISIQVW